MTETSVRLVHLEDSPLDAELVREQILREELDVELTTVATREAFLAALETEPDVILADFALPGYDGLRALEDAKARTPMTPFVFVSGALGEERAVDALRRGATDFVLKSRLDRVGPALRRAIKEAEDKRARKLAEEERDRLLLLERRARKEAEAANRMKDEFLAVVSHELRTPLNAILGWTQLLRAGARDAASLDRALAVIERNARAQTRLVDDVLDATRIMQGKLRLEKRNVRVAHIVEAAVEAVRPHAQTRGVELVVNVADDAGSMAADGERLQQVVWNLVSNAVKFSKKGDAVVVDAHREGAMIQISVTDRGIGISREDLPRVFDRFYQADGEPLTRKQKGLGLGLAIVRSLVELHGGTVAAESAGAGQGASFVVRIPIPAIASSEAPDSTERPESGTRWSIEGLNVLIVDDEQDHRELLREVMESQGALVTVADSAFAALDALVHHQPEVVLSDVGMPNMDGYTLARRIRALDWRPRAVVAITAFAREEDRRRAMEAGFDMFLTKPVDPDHLVEIVARLVHQSRRGAA